MSTFGTVLFKEGNFFVEFEGKQELLPVSHENVPHAKELVGKKVEVLLSEPQRFIAGLILAEEKVPFKRPRILCYKPIPDFLKAVIDDKERILLARQLFEAKIVNKETFEKLAAPLEVMEQKKAV
jgi:hypothetical protein